MIEQLYEKHAASCLKLARSILIDAHHAEDAVQEPFLDLWRHRDRFDAERSPVRPWLLLLTRRRAVDRVRLEQHRQTSELFPLHDREDEQLGPEARAVITAVGDQTREALAALSPAKREALVLAYWGGYTQHEIATLTSTPLGTIKSRMHAAMKDLSTSLREEISAQECVPRSR